MYQCTRKNSILDLLLTNNPNFSSVIKTSDINISDHSLVKIYTPFFSKLFEKPTNTPQLSSGSNNLDFSIFNLKSCDFSKIQVENFSFSSTTKYTALMFFPFFIKKQTNISTSFEHKHMFIIRKLKTEKYKNKLWL